MITYTNNPNDLKNILQKYTDLLTTYQCCLASLAEEMLSDYFIGDIKCADKISGKINLGIIYLRTLKRQEFSEDSCEDDKTYCLMVTEIVAILEEMNEICKECCNDIDFLKICI